MKVCIVTVYNSTNCGSFLQAYSLKYILETLGAEVSFLETKIKNNRKIFFRKSFRSLKKGNMPQVKFEYNKYRNFTKCLKEFPLCRMNEKELSQQDLFVLGSDEIWNVSRDDMRKAEIFWGCGLEGNVISYAPSVNTSTKDDMAKAQYTKTALEKMKKISVRDSYSKKLISEYTDKEIDVLCDPTFLLPKEEYERIKGECPYNDFILIYSAGSKFTEKDIKAIKKYAQKKNKKLMAFPHNLKWCDVQVPAHPLNVIDYFMKADKVITDTFHGAALSLIFNKDFLALPRGNTKVTELLEYFEVPQLMRENAEQTEEYFEKERYSKEKLNDRIMLERKKAENYLRSALGVIEK